MYHPNAYLRNIKNVKRGLETRTRILRTLARSEKTIGEIAIEAQFKYPRILRHMRHLEVERLVERLGDKKPFKWRVTGLGQQRLIP